MFGSLLIWEFLRVQLWRALLGSLYYLAKSLRLNVIANYDIGHENNLSPQTLNSLISRIKKEKNVIILTQKNPNGTQRNIAKYSQTKLCQIDTVTNYQSPINETYIFAMEDNIKMLQKVLK